MSPQNINNQSTDSNDNLDEERQQFAEIQTYLAPIYRDIFPDRVAPRTVIIVPSASLDYEVLSKISGVHHYEERMLWELLNF